MSLFDSQPGRHMLDGAARLFAAEALFVPTGVLTAMFLARRLTPAGYGVLAVAATLVAWVEWSTAALFSRASVKFVGEAADWRPVADRIVRLYLGTGLAVGLLLFLASDALAALLREPSLRSYLRLFSADVPLFMLAQAHRHVLVGRGDFRPQALASACRWVSRLLLVVCLVGAGLSITGAILGHLGASLVELAVGRFYVRPSLWRRSDFSARRLWGVAVPLFLAAMSLRLFDKLDLLMLKALGGTAAEAGCYGAAQNLTLASNLLALSVSPLLLSTLSRLRRGGAEGERLARAISADCLRLVVRLLPFALLVAASASEIVALIFGADYLPAARPLALLINASLALLLVSVCSTVLIAAGDVRLTVALSAPLPFAALAGHFLLIPRLGALGAGLVTAAVTLLAACASLLLVRRRAGVRVPLQTFGRSLLVGALGCALALLWPAGGAWVLLKLPLISLALLAAFALLGEFDSGELNLLRSRFASRGAPATSGGGTA